MLPSADPASLGPRAAAAGTGPHPRRRPAPAPAPSGAPCRPGPTSRP